MAMMARAVSVAASGLSRAFDVGGGAGAMSRPGQLWGVCDHAVITELGGVHTSDPASPYQPAGCDPHPESHLVVGPT